MQKEIRQSDDSHFMPISSIRSGKGEEVSADVYYYTNQIVNVIMIGDPLKGDWILVDTGMPACGEEIVDVAEKRFGKGRPPVAIVLTHGHFDHVGNVVHLVDTWNVPVYAHPLEFPFITGEQNYPKPDSSVQGGLLAKMAFVYPHNSIDIKAVLHSLPFDGTVPGFADWHWLWVPGHSPGQVALFRKADKLLIAADAILSVRQDALYNVLIQKKEVNGPPRYLTTDWVAAKKSAETLAALDPNVMVCGHGIAMKGDELKEGLKYLIENFETFAVPRRGRFVQSEAG